MPKFFAEAVVDYVWDFMCTQGLLPPTGRVWVAASAGADSFCLAKLALTWRQQGRLNFVGLLHVNHGLRTLSDAEEALLAEWCQEQELPLRVHRLACLGPLQLGLEGELREQRYQFLKSQLQRGEYLYTAHHLNDSFEWWLMSSFKSSELVSTLGIPVKNGPIARPLLCLSKAALYRLAKHWQLPYREDESNLELRFERNFWRHQVIAPLAKKYPSYLKHYVHRQNALAAQLGVGRLVSSPLKRGRDLLGGRLIYADKLGPGRPYEEQLKEEIKAQSPVSRGRLGKQLGQMLKAWANKQEGPLSFSGGVEVHLQRHVCCILAPEQRREYELLDQRIFQCLNEEKISRNTQIPGRCLTSSQAKLRIEQGRAVFPFLLLLPDKEQKKSRKRPHPLFPRSTAWLIEQQMSFQTGANLLCWGRNSAYFKDRRLDLQFLEDILSDA